MEKEADKPSDSQKEADEDVAKERVVDPDAPAINCSIRRRKLV